MSVLQCFKQTNKPICSIMIFDISVKVTKYATLFLLVKVKHPRGYKS